MYIWKGLESEKYFRSRLC